MWEGKISLHWEGSCQEERGMAGAGPCCTVLLLSPQLSAWQGAGSGLRAQAGLGHPIVSQSSTVEQWETLPWL